MFLFALAFAAHAAAPPPALAGTWTLDAARSSDVKPMLARLGVPSFMAAAAGSVTQVITLGPERITVSIQTSVQDSEETMSLAAGATSTGSLFGAEYVVRPRVEGGAIVATGTIDLSGVPTPFTMKRTVDGATMHSVATIGSGASATVLDRVFVRAK